MNNNKPCWTRTKFPNLYKHSSGVFYARTVIQGRKTWRSLRTTVERVARAELDALLTGEEARRELTPQTSSGLDMTVQDAMNIRALNTRNNPRLKSNSRRYWEQLDNWLQRSWPELAGTQIRSITAAQCEAWAGKWSKEVSPNFFNNAVGALTQLFKIGIERSVRRTNPMAGVQRVKLRIKDLSLRLPDKAKFALWVAEIRKGRSRFTQHSADLVEFLAYTGLRIGETEFVQWRHCDFLKGELLVTGSPEEETKNGEVRRVPLIGAAKALLERMRSKVTDAEPTDAVLAVNEAQKAMDRASKVLGMERITHHDLRHFFATICIESGVDIPTVSKWLGHKDGGALAMRVYGHLRHEHSIAAAAKVSFAA